jgi:hypothetical protein
MKPSEYPERLLKALVKGYNDPSNTKARVEGLDVMGILSIAGMDEMIESYSRGHIETGEIYDALAQLKQRNYIRESGRDIGPLYKPTSWGLDYVRGQIWYCRALDYIKAHHLQLIQIMLAIVMVLLAVLLSAGITGPEWVGTIWTVITVVLICLFVLLGALFLYLKYRK